MNWFTETYEKMSKEMAEMFHPSPPYKPVGVVYLIRSHQRENSDLDREVVNAYSTFEAANAAAGFIGKGDLSKVFWVQKINVMETK